MDHNKLAEKLRQKKASESLIALCTDFLTNRHQRVIFKNCASNYVPLQCGVPQGTVLGPLLWNTYIDNLTVSSGKLQKYADDIAVFQCIKDTDLEIYIKENGYAEVAKNRDTLAQSLKEIERWCDDNNMMLSLGKSKHMTIQTNNKKSTFR